MREGETGIVMKELLADSTSPVFWVGVVIVGIVINILSAYLKPAIDKVFGGVSDRWAKRSEKLRQERTLRVERLAKDRFSQVLQMNLISQHSHTHTARLIQTVGLFLVIMAVCGLMMYGKATGTISMNWFHLGLLILLGLVTNYYIFDGVQELWKADKARRELGEALRLGVEGEAERDCEVTNMEIKKGN